MRLKRTAIGLLCLALVCTTSCDGPSLSSSPAETTATPNMTSTPAPVPATATLDQPTATSTVGTTFVDPPTPTPSPVPATDTVAPVTATPLSTATATHPPNLSPTELKYVLSDKFADNATSGIFYCDSDLYPVARADEQGQATKWFAALDSASEELRAILERANIVAGNDLSPQQQLLVYREHKRLNAIALAKTANAYRFGLRTFQIAVGKRLSGMTIEGIITPQGAITVTKRQPARLTCPICLALGTRIDTPSGPVAVQDIHPGMLVWTIGQSGARIAAPVTQASHTPVPSGFQIVHLRLSDGRELFASPGHPTADRRVLGNLVPGDPLDGARVISVGRVLYPAPETYDILPAGETGFYWADGILVGSTLAP